MLDSKIKVGFFTYFKYRKNKNEQDNFFPFCCPWTYLGKRAESDGRCPIPIIMHSHMQFRLLLLRCMSARNRLCYTLDLLFFFELHIYYNRVSIARFSPRQNFALCSDCLFLYTMESHNNLHFSSSM